MANTRRSRARANAVVNVRSKENVGVPSNTKHKLQSRSAITSSDPSNMGEKDQKRTNTTLQDVSSSTPTASQGTNEQRVSKKTRTTGPSCGHPLQLNLATNDGENGGQPELRRFTLAVTRKRTSPFSSPQNPTEEHGYSDGNDGDTEVESEGEWLSLPPQPQEPATTNDKAPHLLAAERPVWKESPATISASAGTAAQDGVPASQGLASTRDSGLPAWPTETELIFLPGSNKVMLTVQRPLLRAVIQDAIEWTRANILFSNAFPDVFDTIEFIKDALITAAGHNDQAVDILRRLQGDFDYSNKMSRLPRARIPLFRREVKDCCVAIIQFEFLSIGSSQGVKQLCKKQLSDYNYTFPRAGNNNPLGFLPMRTRPYRNVRIVNVIRQMFFTGGNTSFANRFRSEFPIHQRNDGVVSREVPITMVALVATALFAAIKEWSTGTHKAMDFSANAFLDVYDGHVNTFKHIRNKRTEAFHIMMSDIYSQAIAPEIGTSAAAIADIELDDIED